MSGRFGWHTLVTPDLERSATFYERLFGWDGGGASTRVIAVDGAEQGSYRPAPPDIPPHWLAHVHVDDADEAARRATAQGGTATTDGLDLPGLGRLCTIEDPQGAALSVYTPGADASPPPEGVFVWHELNTDDPEAAKRFYADVVGWRMHEKLLGDVPYAGLVPSDGEETGGVRRRFDAIGTSMWLVYVFVEDVDAAAARAAELGGTVHVPAFDIPGEGRVAVLSDPAGAFFALFGEPSGGGEG